MKIASTHAPMRYSPGPSAPAPTTHQHRLAPGEVLWLNLESGSTLYCQAGQVRIHALWLPHLQLDAEAAPYRNGARAGWHQVEALVQRPATLHITQPPQSLWQSTWRAIAECLGFSCNYS